MSYIKSNKNLTVAIVLLVVFIVFTVLVKTIDVSPAGETNTDVGFSGINSTVFDAVGVNETWATVTKIMGAASLAVAGGLALIGLFQLIKGKSFDAVDTDIYALALTFILLGVFYVLFEVVVINYRPILEDGELAASYPSSHTMLVIAILGTALTQLELRFEDGMLKTIISFITIAIMVVMPIGRILAGVHWVTDVIAGVVLGLALVYFYNGILDLFYDFNITSSSILDTLHIGFFRNSINDYIDDNGYFGEEVGEDYDDEEEDVEDDEEDYSPTPAKAVFMPKAKNNRRNVKNFDEEDFDEDDEDDEDYQDDGYEDEPKPPVKPIFGGKKKSKYTDEPDEEEDYDEEEEETPKPPVKALFGRKKNPQKDYDEEEEEPLESKRKIKLPFGGKKQKFAEEYDEYYDEEEEEYDDGWDDEEDDEDKDVKVYAEPQKKSKAPVTIPEEEEIIEDYTEETEEISEFMEETESYEPVYDEYSEEIPAETVAEENQFAESYEPAAVYDDGTFNINDPDFFNFLPNEKPDYGFIEEEEVKPRGKKKEKLYIDGEYMGRH